MVFSIFTEYAAITTVSYRAFSSPLSLAQSLATTDLCSVSTDLPILDISYECYCTVFGLLRLLFGIILSRFICLVAHFILFHGWLMFCCIDVAHFDYLFISWQTFWLFSLFGSLGQGLISFAYRLLPERLCICWMNAFLPWYLAPCWVDSLYSVNPCWKNEEQG